jgi:hypothetical protein
MFIDVSTDNPDDMPTLEECTNEYDDTEVSVPFRFVAFSSSLAPGRDLSQFWVVDSTCLMNLTAFRSVFVMFAPPSAPSRMVGVGVDVKCSGTMRISIHLAFGQAIHRTIHAFYIHDLSSCLAQRIGRLLIVSWMQSQSGCESIFLTHCDIGLIMVPTRMGVLKPSSNGLYLLPHQPELTPSPAADSSRGAGPLVALIA